MPRANRYIQPDCLYHLTHRCHDRSFLFRSGAVRDRYRELLRHFLPRFRVPLLNYCITSNHTHLLVEAPSPTAVSQMMQRVEGQFAAWYNRRHHRSGAFWEDRYHCTIIDRGEHTLNCIRYIDLNMVRANVVEHPSEWRWCGYDELVGHRTRYRLLDLDRVSKWLGVTGRQRLFLFYRNQIELAIEEQMCSRETIWTEGIAVGSRKFVKRAAGQIRHRVRLKVEEVGSGTWSVRESVPTYGPDREIGG